MRAVRRLALDVDLHGTDTKSAALHEPPGGSGSTGTSSPRAPRTATGASNGSQLAASTRAWAECSALSVWGGESQRRTRGSTQWVAQLTLACLGGMWMQPLWRIIHENTYHIITYIIPFGYAVQVIKRPTHYKR